MKNPLLYNPNSNPAKWEPPLTLTMASALREIKEERNNRYHKCGEFGCSFCDPTNSLDEV
jgi:hypothetical protein